MPFRLAVRPDEIGKCCCLQFAGRTMAAAYGGGTMRKTTRRRFLKQAAAGAAFPLFTIAGTKASGRILGANDTIRVGVAGIHGQGSAHIEQYMVLPGVQV